MQDDKTLAKLEEQGISKKETNFDITTDDLKELEKKGLITMLDQNIPLVNFQYEPEKTVIIKCGQEFVYVEKQEESSETKVSAEAGVGLPAWLGKIVARIGASVTEKQGESKYKEWIISTDTRESSYLYYTVKMKKQGSEKVEDILIEKIFECEYKPRVGFGKRINMVKFEIDKHDGHDPATYEFNNYRDYIDVPNEVLIRMPRPVFLSVNDPQQHTDVLLKIIKKYDDINVPLAHFMLANLNNTCITGARESCRGAIKK